MSQKFGLKLTVTEVEKKKKLDNFTLNSRKQAYLPKQQLSYIIIKQNSATKVHENKRNTIQWYHSSDDKQHTLNDNTVKAFL